MIITCEKIKVTEEMMSKAGMTRFGQFGIPVDPKDKNKGLRWKDCWDCTESDLDTIEEYFLNKDNGK